MPGGREGIELKHTLGGGLLCSVRMKFFMLYSNPSFALIEDVNPCQIRTLFFRSTLDSLVSDLVLGSKKLSN